MDFFFNAFEDRINLYVNKIYTNTHNHTKFQTSILIIVITNIMSAIKENENSPQYPNNVQRTVYELTINHAEERIKRLYIQFL